MARESRLWSWLSGARKGPLGKQLDLERVENAVSAGFPDVAGYLGGNGAFWCELKSTEGPRRPETPVRFNVRGRDAQVEWLSRRWRLGGAAWLLLQVGSGPGRRLYLSPGRWAREIYSGVPESCLSELALPSLGAPHDPTDYVRAMASWREL